ncbi:LOW QUALITY PROTEIN: Piwi domain-containing protein [Copromyces sp. CBS 386.78]|nr:LOW QUALITY PROTEIN: Piwi domain-containing protein [Copromyces sp. CBS 386.78]
MSAPGSPKMSGQKMTLPTRPAGPPQSPTQTETRAPLSHEERVGKRVDLPADAYLKADVSSTFASRLGFNTDGNNIMVSVNQYPVTRLANMDVSQYDVALSPEPTGGVVYDKVWKSKKVQQKLASVTPKPWIYDGRKLAWLAQAVDEMRIMVDLDEENGRKPKPGAEKKNVFYLTIRPTGKVRLMSLKAYLEKKAPWDNHVLECMSFLDHLLRQGPSERMTTIKRSFFHPSMPSYDLDLVLSAYKGVYASFRLSQNIKPIGLGVNVDVSNQAFWKANTADKLMKYVINVYGGVRKLPGMQVLNDQQVTEALRPVVRGKTLEPSEAFRAIRRLKGCRFTLLHRPEEKKEYKIKGFAFDKTGKIGGLEGMNSYHVKFNWKNNGTEKLISIRDYMREKYGKALMHSAGWPVIETTRAGSFPAEFCNIVSFNQYNYKLGPDQTAAMIKFAVQRPAQRKNDIAASVKRLDWANDKYLKAFGVTISADMAKTEAKVLKHPEVFFEKKTVRPMNTGRWDLRGAKFVEGNKQPLGLWGFFALNSAVDMQNIKTFCQAFVPAYKAHGGKVANPVPGIVNLQCNPGTLMDCVNFHMSNIFKANKRYPEIVFIVVHDKTAHVYERIKKIFDCRYGVVTQVLQAQHVKAANAQYISNVCMKVNAKLGGQTSSLTATKAKAHGFFSRPTMMIGVDVSHASPGSDMPSIAAMCASVDRDGYQYRAAVETNGWRSEVLTNENIETMLPNFLKAYRQKAGCEVEHIYYFRDGVSEGQFAHVMKQEVATIKKVFKARHKNAPGKDAKVTVIVATKRHHIRFFPDKGDRNGNCEPGTLVEKEVTHPFHYDFFLNSHHALQGTARPVHYHVLMDEIKAPLQKMIYHQCYTFCRSTTPISLHPAVYYAHLAGARGRAHEALDYGDNPKVPEPVREKVNNPDGLVGKQQQDASTYSSEFKKNNPPPKLTAMPGFPESTIHDTMWWV